MYIETIISQSTTSLIEMESLIIYLSSCLCLSLSLFLINLFYKLWWIPIHIQRTMSSQGIRGPPYRFVHGNTKEIISMRKVAMSSPMELSHYLLPRILPHMYSWIKLYGKNFMTWYGHKAQFVVTEAELIKEILNNKDGSYPRSMLQGYIKKLLGDGLVTSAGEKWFKLRKLANHAFHKESLEGMIPAMIASVEVMLERWRLHDDREIEVFQEFKLLTSEVISRTAFGSSYLEGQNIFDMLTKMIVITSRNDYKIRIPLIGKLVKTSDDVESDKLEQGIRDSIIKMIKKREKKVKMGKLDSYTKDFLGSLVQAYHDPDWTKKISLNDAVDECKMSMVIKETLRLYSPVANITRRISREVRLGNLNLPADMELNIPTLALHHNPDIWGEDAHLFKPERFSQGVAKATSNNTTAFLPFGMGMRTCVGLNFATTEAKIALPMILQRYKFNLSPNYVHSPIQLITICPQHGLQIMLHSL